MQLGNGVNGGVKWPFVSHFTGCKFCHAMGADPERYESCLENFDKIYHFAVDQVRSKKSDCTLLNAVLPSAAVLEGLKWQHTMV